MARWNALHWHANRAALRPFIAALVEGFGLDHCLWASDWPYLRAPERVDYGVLLSILATLFPDAAQRRTLLWDTPARLFDFGG